VGDLCGTQPWSDLWKNRLVKQKVESGSLYQLKGSVKEPNISIYFFFQPITDGDLFLVFYLLVEGECQILAF